MVVKLIKLDENSECSISEYNFVFMIFKKKLLPILHW